MCSLIRTNSQFPPAMEATRSLAHTLQLAAAKEEALTGHTPLALPAATAGLEEALAGITIMPELSMEEQELPGKVMPAEIPSVHTILEAEEAQAVLECLQMPEPMEGQEFSIQSLGLTTTGQEAEAAQATAQMEATAELAAEAQAHPIIAMLQLAEPAG